MNKFILVSGVLAVWAAACLIGCSSAGAAAPQMIADRSVAADLQALADETWLQFLAVFKPRAGCFGDVHLRADYDLDERAAYDPLTAIVTVRVPATKAMLQGALVHEWAHHIEYQCKAHNELRLAFLVAQGLPAGTPWRGDKPNGLPADEPKGGPAVATSEGAWSSIPSEQYAEATIELVLGSRAISTAARVSPQAIQVIARWAAGK